MRLAILSDIHGNPLALDAVLTDIQSQGEVDAYWVLGDFAALGYDPVTPLENHDRPVSCQFHPWQYGSLCGDGGSASAAGDKPCTTRLCCHRSSRRSAASPGPGAISVQRAGWTGSRACRWKSA